AECPPPKTHPLSLHDALPIYLPHDDDDRNLDPIRSTAEGGVELVAVRVRHDRRRWGDVVRRPPVNPEPTDSGEPVAQLVHHGRRSEGHTSVLQSREKLVCRLM